MDERIYISGSFEFNSREKHVPAPILRKVFDVSAFSEVRIEISVVGFYRLFINGKEITKGMFAPYIANPDDLVYYDEYDVSGLLKEKDNVLCVLLGNGFGNSIDCNIWDFEKASFRAAPKLYLGLYLDGKRVLTTDGSWTASDSAITFDDLRSGERYDARLYADFNAVSYRGINERKAIVVGRPNGEYKKCEAQPILTYEELSPVKITKTARGHLYDFGVNDAGIFRLKINGKAGQRLDLFFGEMVKGGELDRDNISFPPRTDPEYIQHDVYICKDGMQEYTPSFTYHGYQYAEIVGMTDEQATKDALKFVLAHSDIPRAGRFRSSDEVVNKIQACVIRSDLSNFYYFPTDCPHREKNGWSDDAGISAEQINYNFDAYESYREWFHNIRRAQKADGQLPGIIPTSGWGYHWGNGPLSDIFIFEIPYQLYRFTGKKEIIEENMSMMERYVDYMESKIDEKGLLCYGLEDWCEAGHLTKHACATPTVVTDTLLGVAIAQLAKRLSLAIGKTERVKKYESLAENFLKSFRKEFVEDGYLVQCRSQTAQAMAIKSGVFSEENEPKAYAALIEIIKSYHGKLHIGVTGSKYLFNVLAEHGDAQLALDMIRGEEWPSYGYLVGLGATTLWEVFQRFDVVNGEYVSTGDYGTVSLNHHFWGSVSAWFYKYLAGLKVVSAEEIEISPSFVKSLDYAEAEYGSNGKYVKVAWHRTGDRIKIVVTNYGYRVKIALPEKGLVGVLVDCGTTEYEIRA